MFPITQIPIDFSPHASLLRILHVIKDSGINWKEGLPPNIFSSLGFENKTFLYFHWKMAFL